MKRKLKFPGVESRMYNEYVVNQINFKFFCFMFYGDEDDILLLIIVIPRTTTAWLIVTAVLTLLHHSDIVISK